MAPEGCHILSVSLAAGEEEPVLRAECPFGVCAAELEADAGGGGGEEVDLIAEL